MKSSKADLVGVNKWKFLIPKLWVATAKLIRICLDASEDGKPVVTPDDPRLNEWYEVFKRVPGTFSQHAKDSFIFKNHMDTHLTAGFPTKKQLGRLYPRIVYLTIEAFNNVRKTTNLSKKPRHIPSPLFIIHNLLIDPENPYTSAYSIFICREWLCEQYDVRPVRKLSDSRTANNDYIELTKEKFSAEIASYISFLKIDNRWPKNNKSKTSFHKEPFLSSFCGLFISIRGFSYLWFHCKKSTDDFLDFDYDDVKLDYCIFSCIAIT